MSTGYLYTRSSRRNTTPFLEKDELKMALRAQKVSGAFEKRAPGPGSVVRKPVNPNPGLEVNPSNHFSCIKTFFPAYVLYS